MNKVKDALFGLAVGDALGVPVEFKSRAYLKKNPITDMIGFGTHNQTPGTWSDDSSLTFCLAETLSFKYDIYDLAERFIKWNDHAYWTAHNTVFDIGNTTYEAIEKLKKGVNPILAGGLEENSNGNGSLMRILPLLFIIKDLPIKWRFNFIKDVSSLTHAHIRSVLACFFYLEYARILLNEKSKSESLQSAKDNFLKSFSLDTVTAPEIEIMKFERIYNYDLKNFKEHEIFSSGYVIHSLEASIWCFLNSESYEETVLKAVNLRGDTDTTAAIAGGLAGIFYGYDNIPHRWIKSLAKNDEIDSLSKKLNRKLIFLNSPYTDASEKMNYYGIYE